MIYATERVREKKKKSLTPGWVVYGKRRHAEPPEEDVPPQLYPW
jgi:hypothetical protein